MANCAGFAISDGILRFGTSFAQRERSPSLLLELKEAALHLD